MPRTARTVIPGLPHHITQRGNNRQDVFFVPDDRRVYLESLARQCARYGVVLHGYCLMTNHVHLVGTPQAEQSLANAVGRTHFLYARHVNRRHGRSGHLWQNRFYSCPVDEDHLLAVMRYVERNPVRSGTVRRAWEYAWSSAAEHVGEGAHLAFIRLQGNWAQYAEPDLWRQMLTGPESEKELEGLRRCTRTGRPLVSGSLLSRLESELGRRLHPRARGRPRRK